MEFVTGQQLIDKLSALCRNVKKRLWIAVPFIGNWVAVRKILGRTWVDDGNVIVRLITDISEIGNLNCETIKCFRDRGEIKTLKGLHAKVYIIDDSAVLTSANLTGTAFSKRYEAGIILSNHEIESLIRLYTDWWENVAENIPPDWLPAVFQRTAKEKEETCGGNLKELWKLPSDPGDPISEVPIMFRDYEYFLREYHNFAETYSKIQRLWPRTPLFFETDAFLNYLFHHMKGKPTQKYRKGKPREVNESQRKYEINKYALLFKKWIEEGSEDVETTEWRQEGAKIITEFLNKQKIGKINEEAIKQVVNRLNCMNSFPLAKFKFLNPQNNSVETIRNAWENLLYGTTTLQSRMSQCKKTLKYFGRSSIHELLGYFEPAKYPLRNTNSSAGLRFFGYHVSAY